MPKLSENLTAYESVWTHRLRQRIILERLILSVGNPKEQASARQFLEGMEEANPELFQGIEQYTLDFFGDVDSQTPELFDSAEYSAAKGRKTALKLPQDIVWEDKIIRRTVREYRDLFHPCDNSFDNAMKGLQYLKTLHPELFTRARVQAIEQRDQILTFEIDCKCGCGTKEEHQPADSFKTSERGRFKAVSRRIASARQALKSHDDSGQVNWQFFLDRIKEISPEMLS